MNRYDLMQGSGVYDEGCKSTELLDDFPNPLTLDYSMPASYKMFQVKQEDVDEFWLANYRMYGNVNYDDIILDINNIRYITQLEAGDIIYGPPKNIF